MNLIWNRPAHFFTADTHFGDVHIFDGVERAFADAEEMNETIVQRWNAAVRPRDVVWLLGDVTSDTGPSEHIRRLNGQKYLVAGNHDWAFAGHPDRPTSLAEAVLLYLDAGFEAVVTGSAMERKSGRPVRVPLRGGRPVDLSHFPYDPDPWLPSGAPDPWARWRPRRPARGPANWLIHGHVHVADDHVHDRQVNVAMDMWDFTPVHADVVADLIDREG